MSKLDRDLSFHISNFLSARYYNEDFEETQQSMKELFGVLLDKYDVSSYGNERKVIGSAGIDHRTCRFCNNTRSPLTFKKKAHAISEALGNKTLILRDECDGCNEEFSRTLEPQIIEFFSLYRTIYEIKGKGGAKKYSGKNFKVGRNEEEILQISFRDFRGG